MESKGGKKKSSSSSSSKSLFYEAPLGYSIEDVRPHGGIKKFRSAAYSNVCSYFLHNPVCYCSLLSVGWLMTNLFSSSSAVRAKAILSSAEFRSPSPEILSFAIIFSLSFLFSTLYFPSSLVQSQHHLLPFKKR